MAGKCLRCGACCRSLIVEATWLDVEREPRIEEECKILDGNGTIPRDEASWCVAVGRTQPCPFLRLKSHQRFGCSIYPTRPNECVAFGAGGEKCRGLRRAAGLKPNRKETDDG